MIIGATTAKIAGQGLSGLIACRFGIGLQQGDRGHDLSRCAEATLWAEFVDKCLLDRMKLAGFIGETLNRANVAVANAVRQR